MSDGIIDIDLDRKQYEKVIADLNKMDKRADKALKMAVNDNLRKTRTAIRREIKKQYTLKSVGEVASAERPSFASDSNIQAQLKYKSRLMALSKFKHRKNTKKNAVKAQILKSGGLKSMELNGKFKAFMASVTNSNGSVHEGVFTRTPNGSSNSGLGSRYIEQMMGPSIPSMVYGESSGSGVYPNIQEEMQQHLQDRLRHHLERQLSSMK